MFLADTDEDAATEVRLAEAMVERVAGLILCAPRMTGARLRAVAAKTAVVLANRTGRVAPSVLVEFRLGMDHAVAHVHALGHRCCAHLAGPADSWSNRRRRRLLGAARAERGIELVDLGPYEPRRPAAARRDRPRDHRRDGRDLHGGSAVLPVIALVFGNPTRIVAQVREAPAE